MNKTTATFGIVLLAALASFALPAALHARAVQPAEAVAPPVFHTCTPITPEDYVYDCSWALLWSPPEPTVHCPDGQSPEFECRLACLDAWHATIAAIVAHTLEVVAECCETYNEAVIFAGVLYDIELDDAEAAFQACTQSPARCEYLYCQKLALAKSNFDSARATALAVRIGCIADAENGCLEAIEGDTLNCIDCLEACCP